MSKTIDELNFQLKSKYEELEKISLNTFILNKNIEKILNEITDIKQQIEKLEDKE